MTAQNADTENAALQEAREMARYYQDGGDHWLAEQWRLKAEELQTKRATR